jgi:hypothetical protein
MGLGAKQQLLPVVCGSNRIPSKKGNRILISSGLLRMVEAVLPPQSKLWTLQLCNFRRQVEYVSSLESDKTIPFLVFPFDCRPNYFLPSLLFKVLLRS